MSEMASRIQSVLERYISSINARAILARALQARHVDAAHLDIAAAKDVIATLEGASRIFAGPAHKRLMDDLRAIVDPAKAPPGTVIPIGHESDLQRARLAARDMCLAIRMESYALQKIATVVSELARNIVKYARGGGNIELRIDEQPPPRRFVVVAADGGPGIPNLDEIMAGRHKSKSGLGLGLLGTKKLADRFDVSTSPAGTRVVAEFVL